jgi:hypothetical protein
MQNRFMLLISTDSPVGDYRTDFSSCLAELMVIEPVGAQLSRLQWFEKQAVPIFIAVKNDNLVQPASMLAQIKF